MTQTWYRAIKITRPRDWWAKWIDQSSQQLVQALKDCEALNPQTGKPYTSCKSRRNRLQKEIGTLVLQVRDQLDEEEITGHIPLSLWHKLAKIEGVRAVAPYELLEKVPELEQVRYTDPRLVAKNEQDKEQRAKKAADKAKYRRREDNLDRSFAFYDRLMRQAPRPGTIRQTED